MICGCCSAAQLHSCQVSAGEKAGRWQEVLLLFQSAVAKTLWLGCSKTGLWYTFDFLSCSEDRFTLRLVAYLWMFGVWLETSIHLQFKPRHPLKIELEHDCGKILVRFIMLYQRVATEAMHIYTYMAHMCPTQIADQGRSSACTPENFPPEPAVWYP